MSKIRVLPDSLANKIAAGEVVERPASVVKEMIENSLDADARKINIEIESGGKKLIRIIDDGEGMTRDDAILAFERHATSKLRSAEDLEAITTLGFRGEALPSIASVSKLALRTKTRDDDTGVEVEFNGGKLVAVRDIAWPGGTEMEIKDLFFNIPARRKFLKSDATETFHITNLVQHYALANPHIAFLLINNGRDAIRVPAVQKIKERAYQILGGGLLNKLVEVSRESDGLKIAGYVSNPQEQRSSRDAQYLFVNRRFVRDQLIGRAISEAYRSMMPSGAYPAAVLFIEVPPSDVDVNVHPAKTEVRFLRESAVLAFVREAIVEALRTTRPITQLPGMPSARDEETRPVGVVQQSRHSFERDIFSNENSVTPAIKPAPVNPSQPGLSDQSSPGISFDQAVKSWIEGPTNYNTAADSETVEAREFIGNDEIASVTTMFEESQPSLTIKPSPTSTVQVTETPTPQAQPLPDMGHGIKAMGQIRDSYIVATDEEGLLLIDQHVAHERVLFEQFRDLRLARAVPVQPLLIPETLDLAAAEAEAFKVVQEELESIGIETTMLSGRTIAIKTAPAGLAAKDVIALVRQVLQVVERERRSFSLEDIRDEIAASLACKAAIKINMRLTEEKMEWLIDELMKTKNPMTCPHGRPIIIRYGLRDIERSFKRPV